MRTIYFDCFAGASGDMLLGALLDLGLPLASLEKQLAELRLSEYRLSLKSVVKCGVTASQFRVEDLPSEGKASAHTHKHHHGTGETHGHPHTHGRSLSEIERLIGEAALPSKPRERALKAFRRLGEVEAGIHGVPVERIHFHEVGAIDSIVDITGYFLALELMNIERVVASPLPTGRGFVQCAHGRMPVPAPATAKLLEGVPVIDNGMEGEVLTPTGALLLSESAEAFCPMPAMTITRVGYGSGERNQPIPNVVRAILGDSAPAPRTDTPPGTVAVLETNIDDMSAELFPYIIERTLSQGALEAFVTPTVGKKGRPAHLLTVLCPTDRQDELTRLLFLETTTLGVRFRNQERTTAERDWLEVDTPWGRVRVKRARYQGETVNISPEFEDCRKLADSSGMPLKDILNAATAAGKAAADLERDTEKR